MSYGCEYGFTEDDPEEIEKNPDIDEDGRENDKDKFSQFRLDRRFPIVPIQEARLWRNIFRNVIIGCRKKQIPFEIYSETIPPDSLPSTPLPGLIRIKSVDDYTCYPDTIAISLYSKLTAKGEMLTLASAFSSALWVDELGVRGIRVVNPHYQGNMGYWGWEPILIEIANYLKQLPKIDTFPRNLNLSNLDSVA